MAYPATKYRELWDDVPAELLVAERDRAGTVELFPNLAASGLIAYPDDLSAEAFDDLDDDRISSEVDQSEVRLLHALVDFHTRFHGWRLFAEEHLDITLDALLDISAPEDEDEYGVGNIHGINEISEGLCENILSIKHDYLEAYPALLEEWADDMGEDVEEVDLDARAQNFADGLADAVNLP